MISVQYEGGVDHRQTVRKEEWSDVLVKRGGLSGGAGEWSCCRTSPAMQCWALSPNHFAAVSEGGWARGWRQPRRVLGQTERQRVCAREVNVSKNQRVCSGSLQSRTQPAAHSQHISSPRSSHFQPLSYFLSLFACLFGHQHRLLLPPPLCSSLPVLCSCLWTFPLLVDGVRCSFSTCTPRSSSLPHISWASVHLAGRMCVVWWFEDVQGTHPVFATTGQDGSKCP